VQIPIKVVSLKRSTTRREEFVRNNPGLAYAFFDAVDGKTLIPAILEDPKLFVQPLRFPSLGAYGCALSHLRLWEQAIDSNEPLTIAEDDAVFRRDFPAASAALIEKLPPDWDLVMWGWNFDSILSVLPLRGISPAVMVFNQDDLRAGMNEFRDLVHPAYPLELHRCFGTVAYTISPGGARKFKEHCFPMKQFDLYFPLLPQKVPNTGVDIAMNRVYPDTRSFAAFPPLVATPNDTAASTVQR